MTGVRALLAEALREAHYRILGGSTDVRINPGEVLADVLLSLPGIAIVDLSRIDPIAEVIAKNWPDTYAESWPWSDIPEGDREAYRGMARAALLAAVDGSGVSE